MIQSHRKSFLITIAFISLLPIFFIPGGALSLDVSKSALLALGVVAAVLIYLLEVWREDKIDIPWHPFVLITLLLPLVYLLSALLSTPSALSLFGYNFEVGTFGYVLFGSVSLVLVGMIFTDISRTLQALTAFFISFTIVALFATLKILTGGSPVWGVFFGNMGNTLGRWTDLAVTLGLLSVFSILVIGMIPMKKSLKMLSYGVFGLSTILLVVINFSTALYFTLGASVILFVYFATIEKNFLNTALTTPQVKVGFISRPTFLPIVLGVMSLIFLINPTVSKTSGTIGNVVANTFNVVNTEVRPSFSATLSVSKAALSERTFLGSGPNTFSHDWLVYKPVNVNSTPFWGVSFPFGVGFIPTQLASTGVLGIVFWIAFFAFLVILGVKALAKVPESRGLRFALIITFTAALYLWVASFFYAPSGTVLMFAFIFSGLFLAVIRQIEIIPSRSIIFSRDATTHFVSMLFLVIFAIGAVALGYSASNKTLSSYYFKKAIDLSNMPETSLDAVESALNKAVKFAPADIHYIALSRIYFAKAQLAANRTEGTPEENLAEFQGAISNSIMASREAVAVNPAGYENWIALGVIYSSLVPEPLSVAGAYENARFAYLEAAKRNPVNPETPLLLARLELSRADLETARSLIRESLAFKEDYADAYLLLAQLEVQANNIGGAIASAERLANLIPNNPAIYFELGLLKYSNKDFAGAANAFSLALVSAPDYANAKYYLGLTLATMGQLDGALEQFEALALTNPDSQEVELILQELRAGRNPFLDQADEVTAN